MTWQPIETAPKGGVVSHVLLANAGGIWIAKWQPVAISGYRFDQPWQSCMLNHYHIDSVNRYMPPTHWMPLPAGATGEQRP